MERLSEKAGRKFMKSTVNAPGLMKRLIGGAFEFLLDGGSGEDDQFKWSLTGPTTFHPGQDRGGEPVRCGCRFRSRGLFHQ